MRQMTWRWTVLILVLLSLLAACATSTPAPSQPEAGEPATGWDAVADRVWVLVGYGDALNPTVVEEGAVITAVFSSADEQLSGSGGCNNYFTAYAADDKGNLSIEGPIGSTMMACEEGGETEAAYLTALETVGGYTLTEQGRLELDYDSGQPYDEKLIFAPGETPLAGTTWQLVSYGDPNDLQRVAEGTSVTAIFSPETDTSGTLAGNATCNGYTTSYTLDGDKITVGLTASTQMNCPVGAKQETAYLAALGSAQTFEIVGPNLQMTYDGGVLNYTSLALPLENILWQAEMIVGERVPADVAVTLLFTPDEKVGTGTVSGNAACGVFSAVYKSQEGALSITGRMNTSMADCPGGSLNRVQRWYLQTISTASGYEILGDRMVLNTREGDIVFAADREPLVGTTWTLVSLGDIGDPQPPVEGSHFTAQFSRLPNLPSGVVEGETGCNDYNAIYTANLNEIKINLPTKSDNEDCPWGIGNYEVEQQFFLGLNAATEYRIIGDILQISYGEKDARQMLSFIATPPEVAEALDLSSLHDTFWHLTDIGDVAVLPETEITAGFDIDQGGVTGAMSGSSGCNTYNVAIGENFAMGPIASTQMACDQPLMDQEATYLSWLQAAYGYSMAGDQLFITTGEGILTYTATPPGASVPPTAIIGGPELGDTTQALTFDGSQSTAGSSPIASYDWDMGDGSVLTGVSVNHSYDTPGTYAIKLAVTDEAGLSDTATLSILISPAIEVNPPTAIIEGPETGSTGEVLIFDGSNSTAGANPIASYEWDMGDGATLDGATIQYTYKAPGEYEVTLTVTDETGVSDATTLLVQISSTS